ncbi:MAG: hypothetical protein IJO91_08460 [Oscillospiraceae bacterium]|nr:hypothetical protein [Oscillospiraceae bacterium]
MDTTDLNLEDVLIRIDELEEDEREINDKLDELYKQYKALLIDTYCAGDRVRHDFEDGTVVHHTEEWLVVSFDKGFYKLFTFLNIDELSKI